MSDDLQNGHGEPNQGITPGPLVGDGESFDNRGGEQDGPVLGGHEDSGIGLASDPYEVGYQVGYRKGRLEGIIGVASLVGQNMAGLINEALKELQQ